MGLLEHEVKITKLDDLYQRMFANWCFSCNNSYHKGDRILVAWNPICFHINIIAASSQFMHCYIKPVSGMCDFYCSFIYVFNDNSSRKNLWVDLKALATQDPWLICGDFNCVMDAEEYIGVIVTQAEMVDILDCMQECQMHDIKSTGSLYTWNNKQKGVDRVYFKLDRVMINSA